MDRAALSECGFVLLAVLLLTFLMSALGVALSLVASSEAMIAANFREGHEARYAAEAAAGRAIAEAAGIADWNQLLDGSRHSDFFEPQASGPITLADGTRLDPGRLLNLANCQRADPCSAAEMDAVTAERPWGANNPRWQLFSSGWLRDLLTPGALDSSYFTVVLVGDDRSEADSNPLRDAVPPAPGSGVIELRAYALGPRGSRRVVEATIARGRAGETRAIAWRTLR